MLEHVDEGLWAARIHHTMMGIHLGARMSVVRLKDDSLLVHSPVKLTDELKAAVDALGPISHITAPNLYHHTYAGAWADAYPEAMMHGAPGLAKKRKDLRIDATLGGSPHPDWEGTLIPIFIEGCMLAETLFVHPSTRSVVAADLTENFTSMDHFPTRAYLKMSGIYQNIGWSKPLRALYRDKKAARRSIDALLEHDFDRVIIAHGDIIETGGPDAVRQTFRDWLR